MTIQAKPFIGASIFLVNGKRNANIPLGINENIKYIILKCKTELRYRQKGKLAEV